MESESTARANGSLADEGQGLRLARRTAWRRGMLGLFAVFLALRLWGIDFGAPPRVVHPDERHYVDAANQMSWEDLNPHSFENPPLLTYVLFAARQVHQACTDPAAAQAWFEDGGLHRVARWICAVLGALTALVVAATARRLSGRDGTAVAAAVIVGLSFLHGRDSHYGVNDVPMVFLVAVSLWGAVRGLLGHAVGWLYVSAVMAGLAAATKYNGAVALSMPVVVLVLRSRPRAPLHVIGVALAGALAFVAAHPFSVLGFEEFRAGFVSQYVRWGDHYTWGQSRAWPPLLYLQACWGMLGVAHLLAATAGWVLLARHQRRLAVFLAALPVLYLAGLMSKRLFFWRFALPLLPCLALAAAHAWGVLAPALAARLRRWPQAARAPAVLALLLVGASAEPAARLARHDQLLTRPHTWQQARDWIEQHVPDGAQLFLEGFPGRFPERLRTHFPRLHVDRIGRITERTPDGRLTFVVDEGGYLVTDSFYEHGWQLGEQADRRARFYRDLKQHFPILAEFPPGPSGDPQPFVLDSLYSPLLDLWSVERPGYTVRIWRIEPGRWRTVMGGGGG